MRMDQLQLRGRIIIEQVLVVAVLEQVFIGAHRGFLAVTLLDDGPFGNFRLRGDGAAARGNGLYEQRAAVRHPLHGVAQDRADLYAFHFGRVRGCGLSDPQLDAVRRGVREYKLVPGRRPFRRAQVGIGGKAGHFARLAGGHVNQAQSYQTRWMMAAVCRGIDAQPRQPQHGSGEIGDWRIRKTVYYQELV